MDTYLTIANIIALGLMAVSWSKSDALNFSIKSILVAITVANIIHLGRLIGFIIKI